MSTSATSSYRRQLGYVINMVPRQDAVVNNLSLKTVERQ